MNWCDGLYGYAVVTIVAWIFIWVIQTVIINGLRHSSLMTRCTVYQRKSAK